MEEKKMKMKYGKNQKSVIRGINDFEKKNDMTNRTVLHLIIFKISFNKINNFYVNI